jgi:hypothetical protein
MLDDLTTLPAKRREKRLEELADEALPCRAVTVFDGSPDDGLSVALYVDTYGRRDVLDLARVVEDDARVRVTCDWSLLSPAGRRNFFRLLLRASFERPVHCTFTVSFDVRDDPGDRLRGAAPLLLAATRLVFVFDGPVDAEGPLVWIDAPVAKQPLVELLKADGASWLGQ